MKNVLASVPESWGEKFVRDEMAFTLTRAAPNSINMQADAYFFLTMLTAQPNRQRALNSDRHITGYAPIGSLEIIPLHSELAASWTTFKECLLIAISHEKMRYLARCEHDDDVFEITPPTIGQIDKQALWISQQIREEIKYEQIGYGESLDALLTIFTIHVLRNYSSLSYKSNARHPGKIGLRKLKRVEDYIRANLSRKLTIEQLSEIAELSPSHFSRAFRETLGIPPHQYIMSLRLDTARELLLTSSDSLESIASLSGFANNSHMTVTMRRVWGLTPSQARKKLKER